VVLIQVFVRPLERLNFGTIFFNEISGKILAIMADTADMEIVPYQQSTEIVKHHVFYPDFETEGEPPVPRGRTALVVRLFEVCLI
jgi:hypothetical protein